MTERLQKARNRLISAALRVAAAERGGLDSRDQEEEVFEANQTLDEAIHEMEQARIEHRERPA